MPAMWDNLTLSAAGVIYRAKEEARRFGQSEADTEHLLLGLLALRTNVACAIITRLGVDLDVLQGDIETGAESGEALLPVWKLDFSEAAQMALALAEQEAGENNAGEIGTEHILLGLVREEEGAAGRLLAEHGVTLERVRAEIGK